MTSLARVVIALGGLSGGYGCAPASHIEITAYGLLALVAGGRTGSAFPVARWLMQQRNQFGGFASTQVRAVCPQLLSWRGS
jgi:hypothetical protein